MALERELEKTGALNLNNLTFDESGYFLLYPTMLGIKVVNVYTHRCVRMIGKPENLRALKIAIYQVKIYSLTSFSFYAFIYSIFLYLFTSLHFIK